MSELDQTKIDKNFKDLSSNTRCIIDINNCSIEEIVRKIEFDSLGYLICIDFKKGSKVVGVITKSDLKKYLNNCVFDVFDIKNIMNSNFTYSKLDDLERDIEKLGKIGFMPVVDSNMNLQFVVHKNSCKSWRISQSYEEEWWQKYFKDHIHEIDYYLKTHGLDSMLLPPDKVSFLKDLLLSGGKSVLELGAGPFLGYMHDVPNNNNKIIIEPLCEKYSRIREIYDIKIPNTDVVKQYSVGGDVLIPKLINQIDIVLMQNMLDHTPEWPFVLSNVSSYIKREGYLYLSTDIDHHEEYTDGHYNITYNPEKFIRLIEQLGFEVLWKRYWITTQFEGSTWVSCFARKK